MANFNPGLNPTSDPDYTRSAGNLDLFNPTGRNSEISNRNKLATLGVLGGAIKGVDKSIQEGAKSELQEGYDKLTNAQGVGIAAANAVVNPENTVMNPLGDSKPPSEEQRYIAEGMSRYKAAYDQGKISNTQYYAQLEALVRNVKSRYPGYNEIIDRQIEGISGIKPANALRQSMMHDMQKQEEAAQAKWDANHRFIMEHSQFTTPARFQDWQKGKVSDDEILVDIQKGRSDKAVVEAKAADLSLRSSLNQLSDHDAREGAADIATAINQSHMDDVMTLAKHAEEARQKGTFDPAQYAAFLETTRLAARQKAMDIVKDAHLKLPFEEVNKILDESGKVFDDYAQVFTKEGVGHLSSLKQTLEAQKDQDLNRLMKDGTVGSSLRALQAARTAGGDNVAATVANRIDQVTDLGTGIKNVIDGRPTGANQSKLDPAAKEVIQSQTTYMGLGDKLKGDPKLVFENLVKIGKDSPGSVSKVLELWKDNLTNPALGDKWIKNSADALFDPKNKNFLREVFKDQESRKQAFQLLTDPKVTESLKKQGGQTYENYKAWTYNSYLTVLKGSINSLQNVADRPYLDLKFDNATGHLELVPNKEGIALVKRRWYQEGMVSGFARVLESFLGRGIHDEVRSLNQATDNVAKILEGDKYHPGEQVKNLLSALAASAPKEKTGVWPWLAKQMALPAQFDENTEFGGTHPNFTQASGTDGEPRGLVSLLKEPHKAVDALKNVFAEGESGGNYNRLVNTPTHPKEINLIGMKVKDVLNYQQGMLDAGNKSSAAGKYQVTGRTLRSLVKEGVISEDDLYDERTQERAADALLERRGLRAYLNGRMKLEDFMRNLGDEWEILKKSPAAYHKTMYELEKLKMASAD